MPSMSSSPFLRVRPRVAFGPHGSRRRPLLLATLVAFAATPWLVGPAMDVVAAAQSSNVSMPPVMPSHSEPGISPDGREIAFVSGGDIWTVPSTGGEGRLLISHPATESRPLYAPDGRSLAFVSTRTGNGDLCETRHRRPPPALGTSGSDWRCWW